MFSKVFVLQNGLQNGDKFWGDTMGVVLSSRALNTWIMMILDLDHDDVGFGLQMLIGFRERRLAGRVTPEAYYCLLVLLFNQLLLQMVLQTVIYHQDKVDFPQKSNLV